MLQVNYAAALPSFTNVAADLGITHVQSVTPSIEPMSGGVAVLDYDGDGREDLFFTRPDLPDVLYRNTGTGFQDVSAAAGFINVEPGSGVASGDINNDGHADLVVMGVQSSRDFLYINDGNGHFTEQAISRGTDITSPPGSLSRKSQGVAFRRLRWRWISRHYDFRPQPTDNPRTVRACFTIWVLQILDISRTLRTRPDWTSIERRWPPRTRRTCIASNPNSPTSIATAIPTS